MAAQDDEIFERARLTMYVGAILGLVRIVSVEFNLLYRWYTAFSEEDTAWMDNFFINNELRDRSSAPCVRTLPSFPVILSCPKTTRRSRRPTLCASRTRS
ncbi:hypothetical protein C8J57DRAFT_1327924 [Mycena rebaudengoi]|nr:hypothetical protein C8J57DRAFT_1327924 [Mycena rebaudengoi]